MREICTQLSTFCRVVVTRMIEERSPVNIDEVELRKEGGGGGEEEKEKEMEITRCVCV